MIAHKGNIGHYLSTNLLQFDSISTCLALDSSVTIQNIGCKSMIIDSLQIMGDYTLTRNSSDSLLSGDRASFDIHFHPSATGSRSGKLILFINEQGVHSREIIDLTGFGKNGGDQLLSLSPNSHFAFSDRSECADGDSISFSLSNPGCDSVSIIAVSENGDALITASLAGKLPITLYDTGEAVAQFKLSIGSAGNYQKQFTITYVLPDGSRRDTTFIATASISKGGKLLLVDSSLRDLGEGDLCRKVDSTIIIQNVGCDTVLIASSVVAGQRYLLNGSIGSHTLAPGKRDTLHVVFVPVVAGSSPALVTIHSNDDRHGTITIPFVASTIDVSSFKLTSSISRSHLFPGDTTSGVVRADRIVANQKLDSIEFMQVYNGDLLTATGRSTSIPNVSLVVGAEERVGSMVSVPIRIEGTNMSFDPSMPILATTFRTCLTDSNSTNIELNDLKLNSGNSSYQECQLNASASSTEFALNEHCGDPLVQSFLRTKSINGLTAFPNPVTSATNFQATMVVPEHSVITVFDVLGNCVLTDNSESTLYTFNGSALQRGVYLIKAASATRSISAKIGVVR